MNITEYRESELHDKVEDKTNERLRSILEDDKIIAQKLFDKRKEEEELLEQMVKEADERRAELYEEAKLMEHRKKLEQLERQKVEDVLEEKPIFTKSLESSMLLPLLSKFEALSKIAEQEENAQKRILRRERKKRTFKNK